jgi:hypothetical protein
MLGQRLLRMDKTGMRIAIARQVTKKRNQTSATGSDMTFFPAVVPRAPVLGIVLPHVTPDRE